MYASNENVDLFPILFPELKNNKRGKIKAKAPPKKISPKN